MDLQALSQSHAESLQVLALLFELQDASPTTTPTIDVAAVASDRWEMSSQVVVDRLRMLADRDLATLDERLGGVVAGARITGLGRDVAKDFQQSIESLAPRRRQARDEYLRWLYFQIEELDRHPSPDEFVRSAPKFFGIPYTEKDIEKAGEWLKDNGFISGQAAWQYHGPLHPTLTRKGAFTVESSRSVHDGPPSTSSTFHTVVNGPANVNNGGDHVSQTLSVEWNARATSLLDTIEESLPALADISEAVGAEVQAARAELAGAADIGKLRARLNSILGFLAATGAGALGNLLSDQISEFLATLTL